MPVQYLARLTDAQRSARSNLHLGVVLAFVAGALNAGGFLAIGLYTSHVTGLVSMAADHLVLGDGWLAAAALAAVASFAAGAATTAVLVNFTRRRWPGRVYLPSLVLEALLLLVFGVMGAALLPHKLVSVSVTALLLCFVMGLQNALITKISNAQIRTTHLTGLVTDIGIELGKLLYWNSSADTARGWAPVAANRARLRIHAALALAFFLGAITGALGFKHAGFVATVPLSLALLALAAVNLSTRLSPAPVD